MRTITPRDRLAVLDDVHGALAGISELLDAIGPLFEALGEDDLFGRWAETGCHLTQLREGLDEARAETTRRPPGAVNPSTPPVHAWLSKQFDRHHS